MNAPSRKICWYLMMAGFGVFVLMGIILFVQLVSADAPNYLHLASLLLSLFFAGYGFYLYIIYMRRQRFNDFVSKKKVCRLAGGWQIEADQSGEQVVVLCVLPEGLPAEHKHIRHELPDGAVIEAPPDQASSFEPNGLSGSERGNRPVRTIH